MKGKNVISAIASILLCISYLTSIVGIDIHINHHDGNVFIASLLCHLDCESLHPDDICHCSEHENGHCDADDEDCENEVCAISITGDGFNDSIIIPIAETSAPMSFIPVFVRRTGINFHDTPFFIPHPPGEYLENLCVLRV